MPKKLKTKKKYLLKSSINRFSRRNKFSKQIFVKQNQINFECVSKHLRLTKEIIKNLSVR